ncbi:MAG: uncharacterized protein QOH70_1319 [Blastocatellia bacterium]|jgi:uncharacterized protein YegP (UPF0339 family)|nr:uncharacterized protein [Blastocatellia bacterium]
MALDFDVRKSVNAQWYWRFNAANGEEIARSSETYSSRRACLESIQIVRTNAQTVTVWDLTEAHASDITADVDRL